MPKFQDWLADTLGTRRWVVAPRLTTRLAAHGYDKAITRESFKRFRDEYLSKRATSESLMTPEDVKASWA